jgi:hypothetical protein
MRKPDRAVLKNDELGCVRTLTAGGRRSWTESETKFAAGARIKYQTFAVSAHR